MIKKNNLLDAKTKLILTILGSIIISMTFKINQMVIELIMILLMVIILKKIKQYLKWLKIILPMAIFFGLMTFFLEDLEKSFFSSLKLVNFFSIFFILFSIATIEDIGEIFTQAGLPYYYSFILITGFNFVPIITRRAKSIFDAQCTRGFKLENKFYFFKNFPAFFGPFLIQSFRLANELAESIETRGFGINKKILAKKIKLKALDWILIFCSFILFLVFGYFTFLN